MRNSVPLFLAVTLFGGPSDLLAEAAGTRHVLLKVNTIDAAPNQAFLDALPRMVGYPQLFVARADGNIIHAQDPTAFLHQREYDPERFIAPSVSSTTRPSLNPSLKRTGTREVLFRIVRRP